MLSRFSLLLVAPGYGLLACLVAIGLPQWSEDVSVPIGLVIGALLFLACALAHLALLGLGSERALRAALADLRQRQAAFEQEIGLARSETRQIHAALAQGARPPARTLARPPAQPSAHSANAGVTGGEPSEAGLATVVTELAVLRRLVDRLQAGSAAEPAGMVAPPPPASPLPAPAERDVLTEVRAGLAAGRVELLLQPIVTLPQRRKRFFECFSRIRAEDGRLLLPEDYVPLAERSGLISTIDNMLLFRCIQLIRRAQQRNGGPVGFFCNISRHSLADRDFFHDLSGFLRQNADLAPSLVFEIPQRDLDLADEGLKESMQALAALGIRFSIDNVTDHAIDPAGLAERNVRYFKADIAHFHAAGAETPWETPLFRLRRNLAAHRIELIVEKVEREQQVVEMLEYDIDFGQGFLFGQPKPGPAPAHERASSLPGPVVAERHA